MIKLILFSILLGLAASISAQIVLPWTEDFEGATSYTYSFTEDSIFGLYDWSFENASDGQLRTFWGAFAPHSGTKMATLDVISTGQTDIASIIIELDLSLYVFSSDLTLSFYYMPHGGDSDPEDCVSISCGTSPEYSIYDLYNLENEPIDGVWNYVSIDLDSALLSHSLFPDEQTTIKFSVKSRNCAVTNDQSDGITFDDISITGTSPQVMLPWIEDFEGIKDELTFISNQTSINGRSYLSYEKTQNGQLRFNVGPSFCHSGSRAATMDCDINGAPLSQNMLIMTLNLSRYVDYDDLELSFYYMQHRESSHPSDKVYIRGSNSDVWIEAYDLYANRAADGVWKEVKDIDIDALIDGAGQVITSTFQIGFSQEDINNAMTTTKKSGITVDDIAITTNDRYWIGIADNSFLNDENWYPASPNYSSELDLEERTVILDTVRYSISRIDNSNDTTIYINNLIVEENSYVVFNQNTTWYLDLIVNENIQNDGDLEFDLYPYGSSLTVYGDVINNGNIYCGEFGHISGEYAPMFLHGNFINNSDCEGNGMGSLQLCGNSHQYIGGAETSIFNDLIINNSLVGVENSVELTSSTNEILIWHLEIWDGSFEINSGSSITIGNLKIENGSGLNLDDGDIVCTVHGSIANFNTSFSSTKGLTTSNTTEIIMDVSILSSEFVANESLDGPFLILGNDTYLGSEIYNLTINRSLPDDNVYVTLWTDLLIKNRLTLINSGIFVMDEFWEPTFPCGLTNLTPQVIVENISTDAIQSHNENAFIQGRLCRYVNVGSYDFPLGIQEISDNRYLPATIDISSINGGLSFIEAQFTTSNTQIPPSDLEVYGDDITEFLNYGYWTLTPNVGSADYDITLTSTGHTNGGEVAEQHAIFKRSGVGDWESLGTHDNSTQSGSGNDPITVKRSNLSGFSDFIIGKGELPYALPVELVSFNAKCYGEYVQLDWETASEKNNREFIIEKSSNSKDFYKIGSIPGCGNCNANSYYDYQDSNTSENAAYYRLKQIDYDGSCNYSDIVNSHCTKSAIEISCSFEYDKLIINLLGSTERYTFVLFDSSGKMIYEGELLDPGVNEFAIPDLSTGVYYLKLFNSYESYSRKLFYNKF